MKRFLSEIKEIEKNPSDIYIAKPLEDDMYTWHFTIKGPKDTDFD